MKTNQIQYRNLIRKEPGTGNLPSRPIGTKQYKNMNYNASRQIAVQNNAIKWLLLLALLDLLVLCAGCSTTSRSRGTAPAKSAVSCLPGLRNPRSRHGPPDCLCGG